MPSDAFRTSRLRRQSCKVEKDRERNDEKGSDEVNLVVYLGASTEDEGIEVEFEVRPVSIDNGADRSMPLTPLPANLVLSR